MRKLVVLLFCLPLASCSREPKPDLLLITVDTLRADRLGCYGYEPARTSFIDRLALEGVRYDQCVSPVPVTLPAHVSLFTGQLPAEHGVRNNLSYRLNENADSVVEALQRAGYVTGAFVSAFPLTARFGLDQGFDHYDDEMQSSSSVLSFPERAAPATVEAALRWLKAQPEDRPVFLWVHLFEPHAPYTPPPPLDSGLPDLYDGEVAAVDAAANLLCSGVRQMRGSTPITIFTADHGEGLGDHGEDTHSFFLYESTLRVPLIVHAPGRFEPAVVSEPVTLCDVAPTLLHFAGLQPGETSGMILQNHSMPMRELFSETVYGQESFGWSPMVARREGPHKWIRSARSRTFDLASDPFENDDLMDDPPDWVTPGFARLDAEIRRWDVIEHDAARSATTAEAEALAALGYIAAAGSSSEGTSLLASMQSRPDGTEQLDEFEAVTKAQRHIEADEFDAVIPLLEGVREDNPGNAFALSMLAGAYKETGQLERSLATYEEAAAVDPNRPETQIMIARLLRGMGRTEDAIPHYELVMTLGLADVPLLREAAPLLSAAGKTDRVLALLDGRLRDTQSTSDVERAELHALYAVCALEDQRADEALPHVLQARELADSPRLAVVHAQILRTKSDWDGILTMLRPLGGQLEKDDQFHLLMGLAEDQTGHPAEAIEHYRASLSLYEPQFVAHSRLAALLLNSSGGAETALPHAARAVELDVSQLHAHGLYVDILMRLGNEQIARNHVMRFAPRFEGNPGLDALYERVDLPRD